MDTLSSDIQSLLLFGGNPSIRHPLSLSDIIARHTELKTLPSLAFTHLAFPSPVSGLLKLLKLSVILALLCFADLWFVYMWRVEKEKSEREKSSSLMLKFLICLMLR